LTKNPQKNRLTLLLKWPFRVVRGKKKKTEQNPQRKQSVKNQKFMADWESDGGDRESK